MIDCIFCLVSLNLLYKGKCFVIVFEIDRIFCSGSSHVKFLLCTNFRVVHLRSTWTGSIRVVHGLGVSEMYQLLSKGFSKLYETSHSHYACLPSLTFLATHLCSFSFFFRNFQTKERPAHDELIMVAQTGITSYLYKSSLSTYYT